MMSVHREKISKDKQGYIERELDRFGRDPRRLQLLFRSDTSKQGRIKVGGNGGNCRGPSALSGPPVMHLFVLNKIFVWNIVVIQKWYKNATLYSVEYH